MKKIKLRIKSKVTTDVSSTPNTDIDINMFFRAMEVYLQEYTHREKHMWSQNYRFFFSSLIVMLLPNLTDYFSLNIPKFLTEHAYIFPLLGIVMSVVFLYVSLNLGKRFKAISDTYNDLIKKLPEAYKRISIEDMPYKFLNKSNYYPVVALMFLSLILIATLLLASYGEQNPLNDLTYLIKFISTFN